MTEEVIRNLIRKLVLDLVNEEYEKVYENDFSKRISAELIKEVIEDYPAHISTFPDSAFDLMSVFMHSEFNCDLDFPLWYDNERSDLTLVCNIKNLNDELRYSIDDILVQ
jgi:hypothetical protein